MLQSTRDWVWRGWQVRYTFITSSHQRLDSIPILLIHGFGSSQYQWTNNIQSLGEIHPVYALDLLGFGASQKAATRYNVNFWAEQVHEFWRSLINRPMIVIGHSLGALVAATVASQFPHSVAGTVLMTLPATRQEQVSNAWIQNLLSMVERSVANPLLIRLIFNIARQRRFIQTALRSAYVDPSYVTDTLVDAFVQPTTDRGAAQTLCRLTQSATTPAYSRSRETLLSQIHQPTLLLWGECDRVTPISQGNVLHEDFPDITWKTIPNAGHCFYDECAETVNQLVLDWIHHSMMQPDDKVSSL
ncbi:MAG: alpha/beta fold hydrolase [Cyanobacteria bacterium P01_A01_bin.37]